MASSPESKEELRIVLLGKTGVGLSTLGNAILGSKQFETGWTSSSTTKKCQEGRGEFEGKTLVVCDTPGLFNTERSPEQVVNELLRCIALTLPGPHVLLLVLRTDEFSGEDQKVLESFENIFKEAKRHTIVVFNRDDDTEKGYEKFIRDNRFLQDFINGWRSHQVCKNNNESQVKELRQKISDMVHENEGSFYKGEMFEEAMKIVGEEMKRDDTSGEPTMDRETVQSMLQDAVDNPAKVMMEGVGKLIEALTKLVCRRN